MYLSGSLAFSISLEKGEDDTESRAFHTTFCPLGRVVFLIECPFLPWRGGRDREFPPVSSGFLGTTGGVRDLNSD